MANLDIINAEIADLEQRQLNYTVAERLAIMYILRDHTAVNVKTEPHPVIVQSDIVHFDGDSEFAKLINGKPQQSVFDTLDELMSVLQTMHERLYEGVMRKLTAI